MGKNGQIQWTGGAYLWDASARRPTRPPDIPGVLSRTPRTLNRAEEGLEALRSP